MEIVSQSVDGHEMDNALSLMWKLWNLRCSRFNLKFALLMLRLRWPSLALCKHKAMLHSSFALQKLSGHHGLSMGLYYRRRLMVISRQPFSRIQNSHRDTLRFSLPGLSQEPLRISESEAW